MTQKKKQNLFSILFYIFTAEAVGGLSALITGSFSDFFLTYKEPPLLPPGWLFPVVWTVLYALMGYSAHLVSVSEADNGEKKRALTVYWLQLAFNFSWSIVFFKFEMLWGGFAVIVILLVLICLMSVLFGKMNSKAGLLNIPYIIWVAFATYLNLATALIN